MKRAPKYLMVAVLALFSGMAACDDDDDLVDLDNLEEGDLENSYVATTFERTDGGTDVDILEEGGSLSVTLNSDGTVDGELFVPAGANEGAEVDETLSGTWSFEDFQDEVEIEFTGSTYFTGALDLEANENAADVVTLAAQDLDVGGGKLITINLLEES